MRLHRVSVNRTIVRQPFSSTNEEPMFRKLKQLHTDNQFSWQSVLQLH
ncbi:hypothetical protein EVA_10022 [gut metagenome]|uniref:Uncharacterized protein n=1 Tax=gut metagenome TaxID=749906 RepID=J9CP19_9ZZZZ